jgi:hypothetical protein
MRNIIKAAVLAVSAAVLVLGDAAAADKPATTTTDPGQQIKDGAIQVGQGIKQGAIRLWEATKAAVSAGADKLSNHGTPDQGKTSQSTPPQK